MKLEVLQENLNAALGSLSRVLVTKPQVPILSNILLQATSGKLTLTASNLETTLIIAISAKVETPGDFTVPGRTFTEIISSLSSEKVLLEETESSLKVKASGFSARINGTAATDFPSFSPGAILKEELSWELPAKDLLEALALTNFAAASDEGRAALTGVLFKPKASGLTLVATDGFRLSLAKVGSVTVKGKDTPQEVIVPARSLSELAHAVSSDATVKMYFSQASNQVFFDLGTVQIFSSLIAGNFPDFAKIIPESFNLKLQTTVDELLQAVKLAAVFARDSANIVKFKIAKGKMTISANAKEVGENESEIDVTCEKADPDEFAIAFNYRYLLDFLAVAEGSISLEFSGPVAPGVFRALSNKDFLHLIMPVRVQE